METQHFLPPLVAASSRPFEQIPDENVIQAIELLVYSQIAYRAAGVCSTRASKERMQDTAFVPPRMHTICFSTERQEYILRESPAEIGVLIHTAGIQAFIEMVQGLSVKKSYQTKGCEEEVHFTLYTYEGTYELAQASREEVLSGSAGGEKKVPAVFAVVMDSRYPDFVSTLNFPIYRDGGQPFWHTVSTGEVMPLGDSAYDSAQPVNTK